LSYGYEFIPTVSGGTTSEYFLQDRHGLLIIIIHKRYTIATAKRKSQGEASLAQIRFVLPRRSQTLDKLVPGLIRDPRTDFGQNYSGKESDEASGVNVGHIQGEELMTEDSHLPNVLHHISSSQLHSKGQRIHEQSCDLMAREPVSVRLVSKIAEVFGCTGGIFGLLGQCRAHDKREREKEQSLKYQWTVF